MAGKHRVKVQYSRAATIASMLCLATVGTLISLIDNDTQHIAASNTVTSMPTITTTTTTTTTEPPTTTTTTTTTVAPVITTTTSKKPPPPPPPAPKPPPPPPPTFAPGVTGSGWQAMWAVIQKNFPDATLASGYRCTDNGYHCKGLAIDISYAMTPAGKAKMLEVNRWIARTYPGSTELIHTPGINLWHGAPYVYDVGTQNDHYDHVHWAMVEKV